MSFENCWPDDWPVEAITLIEKGESRVAELEARLESVVGALRDYYLTIAEITCASTHEEYRKFVAFFPQGNLTMLRLADAANKALAALKEQL